MKRVLWVRSVGKGSKVGEVKGLVLGAGEADKSAEKKQRAKFWGLTNGSGVLWVRKILVRRANGKRRMV